MTYPPTPPYAQPAPGPIPAPGPVPAAGALPAPSLGPEPGTDLGADLGAALSFAAKGLWRSLVAFLVPGIVYVLLIVVVSVAAVIAMMVVVFSRLPDPSVEPGLGDMAIGFAVMSGVLLLLAPVQLLWQAGSARAAEVIREGGRPTIVQAFFGPVRIVVTALLVTAITLVGTLLFYLPGLAAAVALMYAIPAAARGASPVAALKESVGLARRNLGTTVVSYLVLIATSYVVSLVFVVAVVLTPFVVLFEIGVYERLNGRRLPDPARA